MSPGSLSSAPVIAVHTKVRGRARFKVAGLYRSERMKRQLESALSAVKVIKGVAANPLTGNVLVFFDPGCEIDSVAATIARAMVAQLEQESASTSGSNHLAGTPIRAALETQLSADIPEPRKNAAGDPEDDCLAWHAIDAEQVVKQVGASLRAGLTSATAIERLRIYGANVLPEAVPRSSLSILLNQLSSTPVFLLITAAAISAATGVFLDAGVILATVGINAAIGYVTESQSERTLRSLRGLISPLAVVIRDGKPQEIAASKVVVGDVLALSAGNYVAADARLVEVDGLAVDESALTGESMPVAKSPETLAGVDLPIADRRNMVYMGTRVTVGQGLAVVVGTGRHTEVGRIQMLTAEAQAPQTPMQRQLDVLGRQLVIIISAVCAVIFGIGVLRGFGLFSMLQTAIALAVAAIPEGLPTIATSILALGILRMRELHALVRRLDAVETLGSVRTVCLDKTGTLTLNRMSVVAAQVGERNFQIRNGEFWHNGHLVDPSSDPLLQRLFDICVLCSETSIERRDGAYTLKGSPTENALIQIAIGANRNVLEDRRQSPTVEVRRRTEERSFMSTVHRRTAYDDGKQFITLVKGSAEQVLALCKWQLREGQPVELARADRRRIQAQNARMGGNALRVLGCAWREDECEPADHGELRNGLIWLGLLGLADPIREGMEEVIRGFHGAGIDTVMITGDQGPTAFAIGNQLHLNRDGTLRILDSTHLGNVDLEALKGLAQRVHVFARVSPAHKLQIVRALQRANRVVAMTGDGINDSPALKAADIGIAMGSGGTEVAREVADIVLEDDRLETMLVAVSQGRTIYSNIRKSVHFLLTSNFSEVIVTFVAMAAGLGQPLTAMQLLWINIVPEISLGLTLALEPPEPDVMEQPPRDPNEPIVRGQDLKRMGFESSVLSAGALGAYGYGVARYGSGPRGSTIGFTALGCGQILHALSSRSERYTIFERSPREPNPHLNWAIATSLALQGIIFFIPWLKKLLGVTNMSLMDTIVATAGAVAPLVINETAKTALFRQAGSTEPPPRLIYIGRAI